MGTYKTPIRVEIDTSQLQDLVDRLVQVDRKAARGAIKKGVGEVTKLVLAAAKKKVPTRTGQLRKSLGRLVKSTKDGKAVFGVVKPRAGVWAADAPGLVGRRVTRRGKARVFVQKFKTTFQGKPVNPVYYAHLVEYGRAEVRPKNKKVLSSRPKGGTEGGVIYGTRVRMVSPRPFMRPAWDQYKDVATSIIARHLNAAMVKFWEKSRAGAPAARSKKGR
jgi:HK97 gp10 family phage protein